MQTINVEVCVVGAGPAGVVAALELACAGNKVLLIDSGGTSYDEKIQALGDTPHFCPGSLTALYYVCSIM